MKKKRSFIPYKEFGKCKRCGKRFEIKHGLRLYCDECKQPKKYRK